MSRIPGVTLAAFASATPELWRAEFPVAVSVGLVDLVDVLVSGGLVDVAVQVETANVAGGPWLAFGSAFAVGVEVRTRRVALGPRGFRVAKFWRVVVTAAALAAINGRAVAIGSLDFLFETAIASPVRILGFNFSDDQRYALVLSDRNVDVYKDGARTASIAIPHTGDQLARVNRTQSLDTLILLHPFAPPWRLFRQGDHDEWDSRAVVFENVPLFQFNGTTYNNGANEKQALRFANFVSGDRFNLSFGGEVTTDITFTTLGATAPLVATALKALPNIADVDVLAVATPDGIEIEFTVQNGQLEQPILAPVARSGTGSVTAQRLVRGKAGGEAIMSALRGWPACATFYQDRLFLGGFNSRPQTLIGSTVGAYFDFASDALTPDAGVNYTIATDQAVTIRQLFAGRHFMIFTRSAEYVIYDRLIAPTEAVGITQTTRRGIQHWIAPVEHDGAVMFVQAGGQSLRQSVFNDNEQTYGADNVSVLAGSLISAPVDMCLRRAATRSETDLVIVVQADGTATALTLLRAQEVTAFAKWTTEGQYLVCGAEDGGSAYVGVIRFNQADQAFTCIERVDPDAFTDGGLRIDGPCSQISGLGHLEGRLLSVVADGAYLGDVAVIGGVVTLPRPALRRAEVGFNFTPYAETMPVKASDGRGTTLGRKKRVTRATVSLRNTANLRVGANGQKTRPVPLRRGQSQLLDVTPGQVPFTGEVTVKGLMGWSEDGTVVLTQDGPLPFEVRALALEVEIT